MKTAKDGTIIQFLLGSHSYDGVWFGDNHPKKKGIFWWRKDLEEYATQRTAASGSLSKKIPTVQELREAAKDYPDTFLNGALYVVDKYLDEKQPASSSMPPLVQVYSFAEWVSSGNFDWYYSETAELWKKDGWRSRTTAELFELYLRRQQPLTPNQ